MLLGLLYDTLRPLISLPDDKYINWSNDIATMREDKQTSYSDLDTLIGRLNHVGYGIPSARHFFSRICQLKTKARFHRQVSIPALILADLDDWFYFLQAAHNGISMNLLTYCSPIHLHRSDACEYGLGGYSAKGLAWRWEIATHLLSRAHINLLEFLADIFYI